MKLYKIDTAGQITGVYAPGVSRSLQKDLAVDVMKNDSSIEQVAFIEKSKDCLRLQMMGDELSINGSLAGGYVIALLQKTENLAPIDFEVSGLNRKISTLLNNGVISITVPKNIVKSVTSDVVDLEGIRYCLQPGLRKNKLLNPAEIELLNNLTNDCPAAGIIFFEANRIQPVVYVKATRSVVWENACGSGSLSFALLTKNENVVQPSGKIISIAKNGDTLTISAPVRKV